MDIFDPSLPANLSVGCSDNHSLTRFLIARRSICLIKLLQRKSCKEQGTCKKDCDKQEDGRLWKLKLKRGGKSILFVRAESSVVINGIHNSHARIVEVDISQLTLEQILEETGGK